MYDAFGNDINPYDITGTGINPYPLLTSNHSRWENNNRAWNNRDEQNTNPFRYAGEYFD